jgi:hypothetical protein
MRKPCTCCGCYNCDCGKPVVPDPIELTSREVYRIRMSAWQAQYRAAFPNRVGETRIPHTEIKLDEQNLRLYIIDNGTRHLVGPKRVRKIKHV